jgi:hypothetical protein
MRTELGHLPNHRQLELERTAQFLFEEFEIARAHPATQAQIQRPPGEVPQARSFRMMDEGGQG